MQEFTQYKKNGSEYDLNNFRPIALLSVPYKLYTTIINNRLSTIMERHNLFSPEQTGFRKDMDTSLNIKTLCEIINNSKITKKSIHMIFIDLSKAYDTTQHWAIEENMKYLGFDNHAIDLIMALYKKTSVDHDNKPSLCMKYHKKIKR